VERFNLKQELKGMKIANKKPQKKIKIEKYVAARSSDPSEKILFLGEGDSAVSGALPVRDTLRHGLFPLRGVPLCTFNASLNDIFKNKECEAIKMILGLKCEQLYGNNQIAFKKGDKLNINNSILDFSPLSYTFDNLLLYYKSLKTNKIISNYSPSYYGSIGIMCDADIDGGHIKTLILQFLFLWPELFIQKRIKIINSPLYIVSNKKTTLNFFLKEDFEKWSLNKNLKNYYIRRNKGLGSLVSEEYEDLLNNVHNSWQVLEIDDGECFRVMFSDNVEARKNLLE
jgi:DNA gyrase/topoisomerase IV subunit B